MIFVTAILTFVARFTPYHQSVRLTIFLNRKSFGVGKLRSLRCGGSLSQHLDQRCTLSTQLTKRSITMAVEKTNSSSSLAEVIDRILDKGIVIDAWARVSLVGIELLAIEARVVIASVETYLKYAEAVGLTQSAAVPA